MIIPALKHYFLAVLVCFLWWHSTEALLTNNGGGKWQEVLSKVTGNKQQSTAPSPPSEEQRDMVLRKLNLTSKTEPKPFSVEPKYIPIIAGASIPAAFRIGTGAFTEGYNIGLSPKNTSKYSILTFRDKQVVESNQLIQPNRIETMQPLVLYDCEGNASCRLVREACSILSLQVLIRPCPKNGLQFVSELSRNGDLKDLPILDDPNTGIIGLKKDTSMILNYLFKTYGNGNLPWPMKNERFAKISSTLAMASRFGTGSKYQTSDPPPQPLTLWSYESSPFCKLVTERLGSLELEYKVIYCPRGSPNRQKLFDLTGRFQVPYLQDVNTGIDLWESSAISEYLTKQYALQAPVAYL